MNNETIKRSDAINEIKALHNVLGDAGTKAAVMALEGIPAGDSVSIVRCRNCSRSHKMSVLGRYECCFGSGLSGDDFCSYGERRQNGKI